jgi:hypothetical protein
MKHKKSQHYTYRLLRALTMNAGFSGITAVIMLVAAPWIAAQLGLASVKTVYLTAGFLMLFALRLGYIAHTRVIRTWEITGIIGGDLVWVLASVFLATVYFESITLAGIVLIDVIAVAVLSFAILQIGGLRIYRLNTNKSLSGTEEASG